MVQSKSKTKAIAFGALAGIAAALIGQGMIAWTGGDQLMGAILMCAGGALFIVDYFVL